MILLCIKIFLIRIIDVSLGTIRSIVTIKGNIFIASLIGFIEVLVWFIVVKEAITTSGSFLIAIFYSLGFATGTYIGGILSSRFIKTKLGIQVILSSNDKNIINEITNNDYALSIFECYGQNLDNLKYMLFIEIDSDRYKDLTKLIKSLDKKAFIVVNETKYVHNGYFAK